MVKKLRPHMGEGRHRWYLNKWLCPDKQQSRSGLKIIVCPRSPSSLSNAWIFFLTMSHHHHHLPLLSCCINKHMGHAAAATFCEGHNVCGPGNGIVVGWLRASRLNRHKCLQICGFPVWRKFPVPSSWFWQSPGRADGPRAQSLLLITSVSQMAVIAGFGSRLGTCQALWMELVSNDKH